MAIEVLVESGCKPKNIMFLNLICAPEGLEALRNNYPEVRYRIIQPDKTRHKIKVSDSLFEYMIITIAFLGSCCHWSNR